MGEILPFILAFLYVVTIHEYSHGWIAYKLGDSTAKYAGRLTLNPLSHLDPIGTLMLIFLHFGYAKPVPVNAMNFRQPRRDMMFVGIAGPCSNVLSAFIFGMLFRVIIGNQGQSVFSLSNFTGQLLLFLGWSVLLNLSVAVFNLIPVFPLDGSHILKGLLPQDIAYSYSHYDRQIMIILLGVVLFGVITGIHLIGYIIWPPVYLLANLFAGGELFMVLNL